MRTLSGRGVPLGNLELTMRRHLALLAVFVLASGFHHHGHHHHHGGGGGGAGCGGTSHTTSAWRLDGTVRLDTSTDPSLASALIHVRQVNGGAPVVGARVTVGDTRLAEIAPGEYVGAVPVAQGEPLTIAARGAHALSVMGRFPDAATDLQLAGSGESRTVRFDERGPAARLEVVARGSTEAAQTTSSFEEDATLELAVPAVANLEAVEVRVEEDATGTDALSEVALEASTALAAAPLR